MVVRRAIFTEHTDVDDLVQSRLLLVVDVSTFGVVVNTGATSSWNFSNDRKIFLAFSVPHGTSYFFISATSPANTQLSYDPSTTSSGNPYDPCAIGSGNFSVAPPAITIQ
ncbi:uncharacterized protein LOC123477046 [Daphnia magna]|uniref:uncharacterized protein LOC123477046 n=1 Tax=Daphnia magna TaxID=35525 RepID=UPI001E1BA7F9|nr:uncharacterized protein LOC123477046 [Daphnia magna]